MNSVFFAFVVFANFVQNAIEMAVVAIPFDEFPVHIGRDEDVGIQRLIRSHERCAKICSESGEWGRVERPTATTSRSVELQTR